MSAIITTGLNLAINSYQNWATLDTDLKMQYKLFGKMLSASFKKNPCTKQGLRLSLHQSYPCA